MKHNMTHNMKQTTKHNMPRGGAHLAPPTPLPPVPRRPLTQYARTLLATSLIASLGAIQTATPLLAEATTAPRSAAGQPPAPASALPAAPALALFPAGAPARPALQAAAASSGQPQALHIVILEGDEAVNNIRERTAREPIVQVEDENHKPVAGAAVLFLINGGDSGAGGAFNAATSFSTVTDSAGRAVAHGFHPNATAGKYTVSVQATVGALVVRAVINETNAAGAGAGSEPATENAGRIAPQVHHAVPKWLLIGGGVAIAGGIIATIVILNGGSHSAVITPGTGTITPPTSSARIHP